MTASIALRGLWVRDFKQGPHPTLSLRERAKEDKALAPLGERVG